MTYAELRQLIHYADGCQTVDEFMSGVSGQLTENAADYLLTDVWKFHDNHTYRTLVEISGIPNRQIAIRYNIPIRTVEDWCAKSGKITPYLLDLLAADVISEKYKQI